MDVQEGRKAIIVGGGRVGRRTAAGIAERGYLVTIIERDAAKQAKIPEDLVTRVIVGDATSVDVFQQANPTLADLVAGLTGDPNTNLAVCELARELVPDCTTLARIETDAQEEYRYLDFVDDIVYPAAAGAREATAKITGNTGQASPFEKW